MKTIDLRFQMRGPYSGILGSEASAFNNPDIVLVDLDDESWRLIPEQWPYSRKIWSQVTDNLVRAGAKIIAFDIMFDSPGSGFARGDSLFAESIRKAENTGTRVILAAKKATESTRIPPSYIQYPLQLFIDAGASTGIVNEVKDPDGFTRDYLLYDKLDEESELFPSFALQVLLECSVLNAGESSFIYSDTNGENRIRYDDMPIIETINFYGPPSHSGPAPPIGPWKTFPTYPLSGVLDDASYQLKEPMEDTNWMELFYPDGLLGEFGLGEDSPFNEKIVIIGASLAEFHDLKETPFFNFLGYKDLMPGFEIHANALQMLIHENRITDVAVIVWVGITLLIAILLALFLQVMSPVFGILAYIIMAWVYVDVSGGLFFREYGWSLKWLVNVLLSPNEYAFYGKAAANSPVYIPVISPLIAQTLTFTVSMLYRSITTYREKRWIKNAFGHFLHPDIVEEITENPDKLKLGGTRKQLSVFFTDIENFTTIAEQLPVDQLAAFLNQYLTELTDIILRNNGMIDKYEGDAIMAEFGAPLDNPHHALIACQTALQIQRRLKDLQPGWAEAGLPNIRTRIGINTGEVALGNFGSRDVFDYTVMGDAVNLGARLESANKIYGTYILISEYTAEAVQDKILMRPIDKVIVKGKTESVIIYEIFDDTSSHWMLEMPEIIAEYRNAFETYIQQDWKKAQMLFENIVKINPNDKPSHILLDRSREFAQNAPDSEWDGAHLMNQK